MTERWSIAIDYGKVVVALFIDFKKAFGCVSQSVLNKKLLASGISGDLHNFTMNYLEDRRQFTVINGESSNTENAKYGVPHGSLYDPRLFTIFSNDLPDYKTAGETEMFADDTTPYGIADTYDEVILLIKEIIVQVENWAMKNLILIHPDKTKIMFLLRKTFIGPYPLFALKDQEIKVV